VSMNRNKRRALTTAGLSVAVATAGLGGFAVQKRAGADTGTSPAATASMTPAESQAIENAAAMQAAFARVAKQTEPAVVTITTTAPRPQMVRRSMPGQPFGGNPFGANPFGDGVDPFEEFFRRGGPLRPNSASPEQARGQDMFHPIQERGSGLGSGFIYDRNGLIITNAHVVRGAKTVNVKLQDGRTFKNAKVLGVDTRTDIAVVKIDATNLPTVTLGDSSKLNVGDWAIAVGNPYGLSHTLTVGVVSALAREVPMDVRTPGDYIQTDASINPGNSGGPLLDIYGRVIGVNNSIWSPTGSNVGIGFAIPVNTAKQVAETLVKEGRVRRAYLGIGIGEIGQEATAFGLPAGTTGVLVSSIEPNGPAAKAGLQVGDVVQKINGEAVSRPADLQRRVSNLPIGQSVTLTVLRGGQTVTINATLAESKDSESAVRPTMPNEEPDTTGAGKLGVQIGPLTPEIAKQAGIPATVKGVFIGGVQPGSPAADAGLQPGDIISRVGQTTVNTPEELRNALKRILDAQTGDEKKVALYVNRRGQGNYIVATIPGK
jgi:serine protease Do